MVSLLPSPLHSLSTRLLSPPVLGWGTPQRHYPVTHEGPGNVAPTRSGPVTTLFRYLPTHPPPASTHGYSSSALELGLHRHSHYTSLLDQIGGGLGHQHPHPGQRGCGVQRHQARRERGVCTSNARTPGWFGSHPRPTVLEARGGSATSTSRLCQGT